MTFALKTENGVSSCGGLLVRPIIGRFCGYLTSGRSPFSNGSAAVAANARKEGIVIPAPSAAMAAPECFMRVRRSIILISSFLIGRRPRRSVGAGNLSRRLHVGSAKESPEPAADTCVQANDRGAADISAGDILAGL